MRRLVPAPADLARHDVRLGTRYVRILGVSPKGRHVHFEELRPASSAARPSRGWLPFRQFVRDARPCGFFERRADGELVWVDPQQVVA